MSTIHLRRIVDSRFFELNFTESSHNIDGSLSVRGYAADLELDSRGNPYVLWISREAEIDQECLNLLYWDDNNWNSMTVEDSGSTSVPLPRNPILFDMTIGTNDQPIIVWCEDSGTRSHVYAIKWTGTEWAGLNENRPVESFFSSEEHTSNGIVKRFGERG